jgi:hypothetical protein
VWMCRQPSQTVKRHTVWWQSPCKEKNLRCETNTSENILSVLCLWFYRAWWHWLWRSLCPGVWHM